MCLSFHGAYPCVVLFSRTGRYILWNNESMSTVVFFFTDMTFLWSIKKYSNDDVFVCVSPTSQSLKIKEREHTLIWIAIGDRSTLADIFRSIHYSVVDKVKTQRWVRSCLTSLMLSWYKCVHWKCHLQAKLGSECFRIPFCTKPRIRIFLSKQGLFQYSQHPSQAIPI